MLSQYKLKLSFTINSSKVQLTQQQAKPTLKGT